MIFQIAGCRLQVDGCPEMLDYLSNFAPFRMPDDTGVSADADVCSVRLGCSLPPCEGEPSFVSAPEGREIRVWLSPEYCRMSLIMPGGHPAYHLQADRQWRQVRSDWGLHIRRDYAVLNEILMLSFIYSAAFSGVVLVHASCIAIGPVCG